MTTTNRTDRDRNIATDLIAGMQRDIARMQGTLRRLQAGLDAGLELSTADASELTAAERNIQDAGAALEMTELNTGRLGR